MAHGLYESFAIPEHFEPLRPYLELFAMEHPIYKHNVFLMMSFKRERPLPQIHRTIADSVEEAGLECIRADGKPYKDDLLDNVYIHMLGCKYGIVAYEDLVERELNPNITLEVGFMLALGKKILFLKERRLQTMPADIIGRLYSPFDGLNVKSIKAPIQKWLSDLDMKPLPQNETVV